MKRNNHTLNNHTHTDVRKHTRTHTHTQACTPISFQHAGHTTIQAGSRKPNRRLRGSKPSRSETPPTLQSFTSEAHCLPQLGEDCQASRRAQYRALKIIPMTFVEPTCPDHDPYPCHDPCPCPGRDPCPCPGLSFSPGCGSSWSCCCVVRGTCCASSYCFSGQV